MKRSHTIASPTRIEQRAAWKSRRNYERAVKLAEQEGHENLERYRSKLQQVTSELREE